LKGHRFSEVILVVMVIFNSLKIKAAVIWLCGVNDLLILAAELVGVTQPGFDLSPSDL